MFSSVWSSLSSVTIVSVILTRARGYVLVTNHLYLITHFHKVLVAPTRLVHIRVLVIPDLKYFVSTGVLSVHLLFTSFHPRLSVLRL